MKRSAGIVLYRHTDAEPEVLLGHMGGPYWAHRDAGAWTIPKGEIDAGDDPLEVARREFREELGVDVPPGNLVDLGEVRQAGGKAVRAWALEGNLDARSIISNTFEIEWPPRSGRLQRFPELDRADWFDLGRARSVMVTGQRPLLDRIPPRSDPRRDRAHDPSDVIG
jgi:predicted NUDIX family NTP pyrophosphohydrolase